MLTNYFNNAQKKNKHQDITIVSFSSIQKNHCVFICNAKFFEVSTVVMLGISAAALQ